MRIRLAAPSLLLAAASLAACAHAAPGGGEVPSLPGWPGALPSRWHAGYLGAGTTPGGGAMHMHYVLVECEAGVEKCPLVSWFQGGPGAAGLFGLLSEWGPLVVVGGAGEEGGVPRLTRNGQAWTKEASVLVFSSPPPVGYSWCDPSGPGGGGESCGPWDDARTAAANAAALDAFADRHPDVAARPYFIAGESYAGVYVPTLAKLLVESKHRMQPVGVAVGDPCTPPASCGPGPAPPKYGLEFLYGHGQVSERSYRAALAACGEDIERPSPPPACTAAVRAAEAEAGPYYVYALYDDCDHSGDPFLAAPARGGGAGAAYPGGWSGGVAPCGSVAALGRYTNASAVREALHVPAGASFFNADNGHGFTYRLTEHDVLSIHKWLVSKGVRVLVYNGDTDPALSSMVAANWTRGLGFKEKEAWRPWTLDGKQRVGGYVVRYEGGLDFVTVRGSGHMVPQFRPAQALELVSRWLRGEEWRRVGPA